MKKALLILLSLITFNLQGQDVNEYKFIPVSLLEQIVIQHDYYTYGYDTKHNITSWVAYNLSLNEMDSRVDRADAFTNDPELRVANQADAGTYYRSGYDRGHLAPAADMGFNQKAMQQSFYLTNVVPQNPSLNRGLWAELEREIRQQLRKDKNLYVVTGTLFVIGDKKIKQMTVPDYLYKIIFDYEGPEQKMIAFMFPNNSIRGSLDEYIVSVNQLEGLSNHDFFSELDDALEKDLEAKTEYSAWFEHEKTYPTREITSESQRSPLASPSQSRTSQSTTTQRSDSSAETTRCLGTAKSTGQRCKLYTSNSNSYCHHHQGQVGRIINTDNSYSGSGRCAATTQKGTRCKRTASAGSSYCWQH